MFYRGQGTPFVRDPWEKWPPKIHFVPPNLRTTRRFLISWLLPRHPLPPPPLPSPRRLLAVFVRLISRLSIPRPFPERIVERLEESASRSTAREKQTKLEEIAFAIVTRPLCRPPSLPPSLPRLSLPRCFPLLCGEFVFRGDERKAPWP